MTARSSTRSLSGRTVRRALARYRRAASALLLAVAVVWGLTALAPARPPVTAVVVAARDLAAGQVLEAGDLKVTRLPSAVSPDGTTPDAGLVTGRTVAAAVRRGEPITDVRLVGPGLLTGGDGLVAAPVRLADAGATALVRPGDLIDVLSASGAQTAGDVPGLVGSARLVAVGVRVLAVPAPGDQSVAEDGALLLLAVRPDTARLLAGAAAAERLSLVIRQPDDTPKIVR